MNKSGAFSVISSFEKKVLNGLFDCICREKLAEDGNIKIGVAVSGGADSTALLYALTHITSKSEGNFIGQNPLEVITVNHFIRSDQESSGDASFVEETCKKLRLGGENVNFTLEELPHGAVAAIAQQRHSGTEDAARFLRYNAFEKFINEKKLDYLCLAHNKNDQLETVLMRFLQGSSTDSASGISKSRGKYIRPMINITRSEIEAYLEAQGLSWREDKTNNDTNYFRNNVRHNLVPFLDKHFEGWEKAVLAGAEKAHEDAEVINSFVSQFPMEVISGKEDNITKITKITKIIINRNDFLKQPVGVEKRILLKACNMAGENSRIPNSFLNDVIEVISTSEESSREIIKIFNNTEISLKNNLIFIKKYIKKDTDLVFFDIIEENGNYDFPFGELSVTFNDSSVYFSVNGCETQVFCSYPFCIRNAEPGDEIKNSTGKNKKIADIFSDWHVSSSHKDLIPIVYALEDGAENIKCILGSFLGYKDWVVK